MATIKVIVRKDKGKIRVNEKGETLIFVQYGHMGKTVLFTTEIKVDPIYLKWDKNKDVDQREPIKKSLHGYTTKNSNIRNVANKIDSIQDTLRNKGIVPTVEEVKKVYEEMNKPKEEVKSFFELMDDFIKECKGTKAANTIKRYNTSLNHLKKFEAFSKEKITIEKINLRFYDKYRSFLSNDYKYIDEETKKEVIRPAMMNNTIGTQIKDLKVFLNYIKKRGIDVTEDLKEFKVLKDKPTIVYLTQEELETLYNHDFSKNPRLDRVRDLYVLQCSTGLRISDLLRLGKEHIQGNNIIKMKAHKTMKNVIIPITPKADAILKKYNYDLPVLSEQRINDYIKEACQIVGISSPIEIAEYKGGEKIYTKYFKHELITTHTAVKTFITHCGEKGISAKVVSEITGKTVKVILDHYYGTNEKVIEMEMQKAFGLPDSNLKVAK